MGHRIRRYFQDGNLQANPPAVAGSNSGSSAGNIPVQAAIPPPPPPPKPVPENEMRNVFHSESVSEGKLGGFLGRGLSYFWQTKNKKTLTGIKK